MPPLRNKWGRVISKRGLRKFFNFYIVATLRQKPGMTVPQNMVSEKKSAACMYIFYEIAWHFWPHAQSTIWSPSLVLPVCPAVPVMRSCFMSGVIVHLSFLRFTIWPIKFYSKFCLKFIFSFSKSYKLQAVFVEAAWSFTHCVMWTSISMSCFQYSLFILVRW
jgi:hypothetical protein